MAGLKRLASFGARGGIGARFVPTGANLVRGWLWAVFCASLAGARNKKFGVGKPLFWGQVKKRAFFAPKKDPKNREKGRALKSQTKQKITNHQLSS